jgi:hypothetical protein
MTVRCKPALWLLAISVAAVLIPAGPAAAQSTLAADDEKGRVNNLVVPASNAELLTLGSTWDVVECCGWTGTWRRRPGSNTFDGRWTGPNGMIATDTMTLMGWDKRTNRIVMAGTGAR